jgi:hypothetical protein
MNNGPDMFLEPGNEKCLAGRAGWSVAIVL